MLKTLYLHQANVIRITRKSLVCAAMLGLSSTVFLTGCATGQNDTLHDTTHDTTQVPIHASAGHNEFSSDILVVGRAATHSAYFGCAYRTQSGFGLGGYRS